MIDEDSSLIAVTKAIKAPAITPGIIRGNMIFMKALLGIVPRLIAASSTPVLICFNIDELERTE